MNSPPELLETSNSMELFEPRFFLFSYEDQVECRNPRPNPNFTLNFILTFHVTLVGNSAGSNSHYKHQ